MLLFDYPWKKWSKKFGPYKFAIRRDKFIGLFDDYVVHGLLCSLGEGS